jgi:hypothetical protein
LKLEAAYLFEHVLNKEKKQKVTSQNTVPLLKVKGKGKVHPRTRHEGPEGE